MCERVLAIEGKIDKILLQLERGDKQEEDGETEWEEKKYKQSETTTESILQWFILYFWQPWLPQNTRANIFHKNNFNFELPNHIVVLGTF